MVVRVGVLGCGMIAQLAHLPGLRALGELFELVAVCDSARDLAEHASAVHGNPAVYESFDMMLKAERLDAVVILNRDHFAPALTALEHGVHTLAEKPLCYTLREAEALVAASQRSGARLMVGYMKRHDPDVRRGLTEIGTMAAPHLARVHLHVGPDYGNWIIPELQAVRRTAGVPNVQDDQGRRAKVLAELGDLPDPVFTAYMEMFGVWSHDINLLRAAFPQEPTSVSASIDSSGTTLTALLSYPQDLQVVFEGTSSRQYRFEESLTVWGSEQTVAIEVSNPFLRNLPSTVRIHENGSGPGRPAAVTRTLQGSYQDAFTKQLEHFHRCVTDPSVAPLTSGEDACQDIRLMQRIIRSVSG
ncbi:Gfo/Idh/MocA family oxidoreductase [Actinoplanes awajinensis]|uniref:Gfo/Idh/MocA-like oxidoreductase N-terminal domain-containing protein n=1 Tax=Actinoplanes awajinensis subsp. mycoplanecinus TaxID=135947 RepID=A0A101JFI4_9ACTN|nr:Gfo/Idh/MocA family oxidoreductase [Actinoplanes awajinensis]KUL25802.1 hypothetical protein ADL15_39515 [Actinoplanes awajinensis subsp. mycoplanecinus]